MYGRFVGQRSTFRVLNHLWTQHYAFRGQKESFPVEPGSTLVVTRASSHMFRKLTEALPAWHPDAAVLMLSSRVVGAVRRLLVDYRTRLCQAGYGPYGGGSTPSSGLVAVVLMRHLCERVTAYHFGKVRAFTPLADKQPYHYFSGKGMRTKPKPVHSFGAEDQLLDALLRHSGGTNLTFCVPTEPEPGNATAGIYQNIYCGWNVFEPLPLALHPLLQQPGLREYAEQARRRHAALREALVPRMGVRSL